MANVHVDYAALDSAASRLTAAQQEMETQLGQLKGLIESLVGSGFITDQASGKFRDSYDQWNTGTRSAIGGLAGMSGFLKLAVSQHQQLDATLSASAGS
ncbi:MULTISPECIES: WXG100 family type VII secretion target [unclassified Frankia]|uniref:WXG100 family type VII secretion target n=1 Tax=unclassified Frankia TaxID=2632575 RepID=UPI002AD48CC9|nr:MULTISPECIES: WXG100 family type VII secretion target [unclassified Frankia]